MEDGGRKSEQTPRRGVFVESGRHELWNATRAFQKVDRVALAVLSRQARCGDGVE